MKIQLHPTVFLDKHGQQIAAGDTLICHVLARWREFAGRKRVAVDGLRDMDAVVGDDGELMAAKAVWVEYHVTWSGACLVAIRGDTSDFQSLMQAELYDEQGNRVFIGAASYDFNSAFDATRFEIVSPTNTRNAK